MLEMMKQANDQLEGFQHRLISMLPGIIGVMATSLDYHFSGDSRIMASVIGAVLLTLHGYLSPIILTGGFNEPIPSSVHLALGSKGLRSVLLVLGMALLFAPGMVRLASRILGAA